MPSKNILKTFSFNGPPLPQNEFRADMHMGKKEMGPPKKLQKKEKKTCFVPYMQFFHTVGGGRTSKTSSSSSKNSSNIYRLHRFGCATGYIVLIMYKGIYCHHAFLFLYPL